MDRHSGCKPLRILLLDDESAFRTSLADMLRDDGHEVVDYGAPREVPALASLGELDVLVTDFEMPGQDGFTFAEAFHVERPDLPVIVVSAYRFEALDARAIERPYVRVMQKPVDYGELHDMIHSVAKEGAPASAGC